MPRTRTQRPDGSWWGRWGVNYVYGTMLVLRGLEAVGDVTRDLASYDDDIAEIIVKHRVEQLDRKINAVAVKNLSFPRERDSFLNERAKLFRFRHGRRQMLVTEQVRRLVEDLEVRFLGNHDPNIHFALLTDLPRADSKRSMPAITK